MNQKSLHAYALSYGLNTFSYSLALCYSYEIHSSNFTFSSYIFILNAFVTKDVTENSSGPTSFLPLYLYIQKQHYPGRVISHIAQHCLNS